MPACLPACLELGALAGGLAGFALRGPRLVRACLRGAPAGHFAARGKRWLGREWHFPGDETARKRYICIDSRRYGRAGGVRHMLKGQKLFATCMDYFRLLGACLPACLGLPGRLAGWLVRLARLLRCVLCVPAYRGVGPSARRVVAFRVAFPWAFHAMKRVMCMYLRIMHGPCWPHRARGSMPCLPECLPGWPGSGGPWLTKRID